MIKIKEITFLADMKQIENIYNDSLDVLVTTEGDPHYEGEKHYLIDVATPQWLISQMEKTQMDFLSPNYPFLVVRKITLPVIKEALKKLIESEEDGYWLKLYSSASAFNLNDLHSVMDRVTQSHLEDEDDENGLDKSN